MPRLLQLSRRCAAGTLFAWLAAVATTNALAASDPVLDAAAARHLLARTGFGPTGTEVQAFTGMTRAEAVERLLQSTRTEAGTPAPAWTGDTGPLRPANFALATEDARKAFRQQQAREALDLRAWWLQEMLVTPSPLTERMTLFWHNHFVSSQQKVRLAILMYRQNAAFRQNALGSFRTLLHAAAKDPAMEIYLDSAQNRKGAPNENFAREVMELFTLGEGHYSEQDVKEAARAFTGFSLDRETGRYLFRPALHDNGPKSVFGQTGRYDGDDVLELLLARPETSEFIVTKLWREFVSPTPDATEVRRIAQSFRNAGYDIKVALRGLLLCDAFWAPEQRGALVKSPVELVVGTLRTLELAPVDALPFALAAAGMSQNLFAPPNVKGWPGGETWINTNTLLARKQFLDRVANLRSPGGNSVAMRAPRSGAPGDPMKERPDSSGATIVSAGAGFVPAGEQLATAAPDTTMSATMGAAAAPQRPEKATPNTTAAPKDDDGVRDRIAAALARSARTLRFDAYVWVDRQPGTGTADKIVNAEGLLLALPPVAPNVSEAVAEREPAALVRAALLDPVYQLK